MAFKKPAQFQEQQPAISPELAAAVVNVLAGRQLGEWSSDHLAETKSFSGWNYMAITAMCRQAARAHVYCYLDASQKAKALRKSYRHRYGSMWKSIVQDGSADLADETHWFSQLVQRPNRGQSAQLFQWEFIQQMHLHGCCLIFNRPTMDGTRTAARYIIPMAITQPVAPGQDARVPNGGVRILPYQAGLGFHANPFVASLYGATIPIQMTSIVRYPHPFMRGDGQSPTDAAGWWIDTSTMIDMTRWKQLKRGPRPTGILSVEGDEITEPELDAIEKRVNRSLESGELDQRAIALGAKVSMQSDHSPVDMDYIGAFDQLGSAQLAIHGSGKAMVGLTDNMTYGSLAAAMQQGLMTVQSDLDLLGGDWNLLAESEGVAIAVEYEVQPVDDPTLVEQQLQTDLTAGMRTGREWRALRGLPPFGDWRDDARVTQTGLVDDRQPQGKPAVPEPLFRSLAKGLVRPPLEVPPAEAKEETPIVAFDLDATLAEYDGYDENSIGLPIESEVAILRQLREAGCQIVIFTCRDNDALVAQWLDQYGIPWDAINANPSGEDGSGKVFAHAYRDDRAVNVADGVAAIAKLLPESEAKRRLMRQIPSSEYGCVMLEVPEAIAETIRLEQQKIPTGHLVNDGLEDFLHVTLLYGIVGASIEEVVKAVRLIDQVDVIFGATSAFDNEDSSVLKIDIDSPALHRQHARLSSALPYLQTHPEYLPHVTLAYMQPGSGRELHGESVVSGKASRLTHAIVSVDGKKIRVPLRVTA